MTDLSEAKILPEKSVSIEIILCGPRSAPEESGGRSLNETSLFHKNTFKLSGIYILYWRWHWRKDARVF